MSSPRSTASRPAAGMVAAIVLSISAVASSTRAHPAASLGPAGRTATHPEVAVTLFEQTDAGPPEIFDYFGLETGVECTTFPTPRTLVERRQRWGRAVTALAKTHRRYLHDWLVGERAPPERVRRLATAQRNCLLDALFRDAAHEGAPETITVPGRRWEQPVRAYRRRRPARRRLRARLTKSHVRSADVQAYIWHRKLDFRGRSFNRISAEAARRCDLRAGSTWKPDRPTHRRCWDSKLTREARQREILTASSAPGISRHHWGTEVDLFGLNPDRFQSGGRWAAEYRWMRDHAADYGYVQTYRRPDDAYIPEPWHWSYYPVAEALRAYVGRHPDRIDSRLDELWDDYEDRFGGDRFFSYVRRHWRDQVHGISVPDSRLELVSPPPSQ